MRWTYAGCHCSGYLHAFALENSHFVTYRLEDPKNTWSGLAPPPHGCWISWAEHTYVKFFFFFWMDCWGFVYDQAPRPSPGPHKLRESLPLTIFLRNRLKYALTGREVTSIVKQRLIKIDGKVRTDTTYPAGFMGVFKLFICMMIKVDFKKKIT